uniref:Uncharacterized protein n=1 Tax=Pelusios castaneus TaxID=367368 RepID=A0A8C8RSQ3_9SAUR
LFFSKFFSKLLLLFQNYFQNLDNSHWMGKLFPDQLSNCPPTFSVSGTCRDGLLICCKR